MSSLSNILPPYADNPIGSVEQSILNHAANFPVFGERMRRSAESPLRPQGVEIVSGARLTQWEYDQQRGWLKQKIYPDANTGNPGANKITYTYTGAGRLNSRTWARGVITQYGYKYGDLETA